MIELLETFKISSAVNPLSAVTSVIEFSLRFSSVSAVNPLRDVTLLIEL